MNSGTERQDRAFEYRRFRRLGPRFDAWALTSEAAVAKDIFTAIASRGSRSFDELRDSVERGSLDGWDAWWVARLGRMLALQPFESDLHGFALEAMRLAVPTLERTPATMPVRKVYFELLFQSGDLGSASELLSRDRALSSMYHGYLQADLLNPFLSAQGGDLEAWAGRFNAPFVDEGLSPVAVDREAPTAFDGLSSTVPPGTEDGPLVSVIVTTFNPDPVEIRTSVQSILQQTWRSLEVLLMDDCSEPGSIAVLEGLAAQDPRVQLIRLPVNGGTYRARNAGIRAATGKYVTGQDTDDWSHPERIAREVAALEADPSLPGVTTSANRTDDRLVRAAVGHTPNRRCEVSLMLRVETARAIGGYLPVRKAADSEFRERLEAWWGAPVQLLDVPMYVIRMSPGSLSRADFRPGWSHHGRRSFWSTYKHWHRTTGRLGLQIDAQRPDLPVPAAAPARIAGREWAEGRSATFDVCMVADWRGSTPHQRAAIDELRALAESDMDVAILHFDTPWGGTREQRSLHPEVQELVTGGKVSRIFADEERFVSTLVVRDPATMDYARRQPSTVSSSLVLVVAQGDPAGRAAATWDYDVVHADRMTSLIFGTEPTWVVPEGQRPEALAERLGRPVHGLEYPLTLHVEDFARPRLNRRDGRLVVGRASVNEEAEWPVAKELRRVYLGDGSVDLRVLGDARGALRVLGERHLPQSWMDFRSGEIDPRIFWRTVDVVVAFDQGTSGAYLDRSIMEALASGTPVVTDVRRASLYGGAVLGAELAEALHVARQLVRDPGALAGRRERGLDFVRDHAHPGAIIEFMQKCVRNARGGVDEHA